MSEEINILNGGVEVTVSLDELAEINVSDVEVSYNSFESTPPSVALWKVLNMEFKAFGEYTVMQTELECIKCYSVKSETVDENSMIGVKHNENIFIKDIEKDIGKIKGFLEKIGLTGISKLSDAMTEVVGQSFVSVIKHSRNKNDPESPYVNMDIKGIVSQSVYEEQIA